MANGFYRDMNPDFVRSVLMAKDILEIFKNLGFKSYGELSKSSQREIGAAYYGALFNIFECWWRKLETGKWDWVSLGNLREKI